MNRNVHHIAGWIGGAKWEVVLARALNMDNADLMRKDIPPQDAIVHIARGFMDSRILFAAYELKLFAVLDAGASTSVKVAEKIGADARAIERLMNALYVIGFLEKHDDVFNNTSDTSRFLVEGKLEYMSGLQHSANMWEAWGTLTEAVRAGTSRFERPIGKEGEERTAVFIEAMHYLSRQRTRGMIANIDLSGVKRVLDVGGGSGENAMAIARTNSDINATVFELPEVVTLTEKYIEEAGFTEQVNTVAGDYHTDGLGEGYDLVLLSQIIHSNSPDENTLLVQKCARALDTGGRLVIHDFIVDEDRGGPPWAVTFALNMLVATEAGDTYTESEVRVIVEQTGLSDIERIDLDFGTTLIIGGKA